MGVLTKIKKVLGNGEERPKSLPKLRSRGRNGPNDD